jgi:hypothetical protein
LRPQAVQPAAEGARRPHEGRGGRGRSEWRISQSELLRLTRTELTVPLRKIACELPNLAEGSVELRNAHANLLNIRRALAQPDFRPR